MTTDKASSEYSRILEAEIKRKVCECGADLSIAWQEGRYVIRCGKGHRDPEMVKVKSDYQLWKEGTGLDPYRDQNAKRQDERNKRNARTR